MPEAGEVEATRRALGPVAGKSVSEVAVLDLDLRLRSELLVGRTVRGVVRIGKHLAFDLGQEDALVCHLGMTGGLEFDECPSHTDSATPSSREVRAVIYFGDGSRLRFRDRRRFGTLELQPMASFGAGLGIDLVDSPTADLEAAASSYSTHRRAAKALMLDQHGPITGAGNYLVDESLFRESIHPRTPANQIGADRWIRVWSHCRVLAERSVAGGRPALTEYLAPDGAAGEQPDHLECYGRAGRRCTRCSDTLIRLSVANRGTTICPSCQPAASRT